jgi:hypothetical protein
VILGEGREDFEVCICGLRPPWDKDDRCSFTTGISVNSIYEYQRAGYVF